jgi:transmembrane sensor
MSKAIHSSEAAALWYIRLRDAEPDAPERGEFERWLTTSPVHQAEYESICSTMDQLASPKSLAKLADAMEQNAFLEKSAKRQKVVKHIAHVVAICAVGLFALFANKQYEIWLQQPTAQIVADTPVGNIATRTLDDGSRVTLSGNSQMEVKFYRHQRHVHLMRGEAIFDVAKDANRPFVVETELAKVTVLGTRFAVNKLSKLVRISVDHGSVRVEPIMPKSEAADSAKLLTNGQVVEVYPNQTAVITQRRAADAFAFVNGKLVFEWADTYEVADTLSRYRARPVVADGQSSHNISAIVSVQDAEEFLQGLPNIAPVIVHNQTKQTVIESANTKL